MKIDYHMHFEYGAYDEEWVEGFFRAAAARGLTEIGISEHTHTFPEFKPLYEEDLILDDSTLGQIQKSWLARNKFKYTLDEYFSFMKKLKKKHKVKTGIEVCNFQNQDAVRDILTRYNFDYVIGSVHFLKGWGYDYSQTRFEWKNHTLEGLYDCYATEVEKLAASGLYDVLGHPFNIRLFKDFPKFDATPYLARVARALKDANMAIDVNTGTFYRYPVKEISPYKNFMEIAARENLPIIITSDAHKPEDCGAYHDEAEAYVKQFGYTHALRFVHRARAAVPLG